LLEVTGYLSHDLGGVIPSLKTLIGCWVSVVERVGVESVDGLRSRGFHWESCSAPENRRVTFKGMTRG